MYGNPTLGQWMQRRRRDLGLTQQTLADRLGCSLSLLRKLERGERRLPGDLLPRLADLLAADPPDRAILLALAGVDTGQATPARRAGAIPAPPGPLIGRAADLAAIQRRVAGGARLLSICGPPGVGKTRLAQHAARELALLFADGVCYVALAALAEPGQVLPALARALDLREQAGAPLAEQLADHLHTRRALLVLDNLEHLLAVAPALAELLAACPQLQMIATSREPLRLRAEQVYPLAPLKLPAGADLTTVARAPAVRLFVDRAAALAPAFALDTTNAAPVAAICARLDGLPLAIELAATRADRFAPAELLAQLDPCLPLLADGPCDLPARQRTLRDAIAWSYELLEPAAQAVFVRLGVFTGGWEPSAALAFCADLGVNTGDILTQIADHSLIQRQGDRYGMLETLREFALEQLDQQGELDQWRRRHAILFAELAEQAAPDLTGPAAAGWFDRLEADLPNLRAAMGWSLTHDGGLCATRIITALDPLWRVRGYFNEGHALESLLLDPNSHLPPLIRARALYTVGFLVSQQGDLRCVGLLDAATALFQQAGDERGAIRCLNFRGLLARRPPLYHEAVALHQQALTLARRLNDPDLIGSVLNNLGLALACLSRYDAAIDHYAESVVIARALGNQSRIAERLPNWAEALLLRGDREGAAALYQEALAIAQAIGHREVIAEAQDGLGRLALLQGSLSLAAEMLAASLAIYEEMGLLFAIIRVRRNLGYLALRQGEPQAAAEQFRASLAHCSLPGFGDMVAHSFAGLAQALALLGNTERAATLAAGAETLRQRYGPRAEPEDTELRAALAPLAAAHPAAWATGLNTPSAQLIAAALRHDLVLPGRSSLPV